MLDRAGRGGGLTRTLSLKTGDDILQRLSFDDKTLAEALLGQLGLQVLWHVLACLCLERSLARYASLGQPLADAAGASK